MSFDEQHIGEHDECAEEIRRLQQWVNDLQSGMFINCVYCGHRYGPDPGTPVAMAEVLKEHIRECPKHPLSVAITALRDVKARGCPLLRSGGGCGCTACLATNALSELGAL